MQTAALKIRSEQNTTEKHCTQPSKNEKQKIEQNEHNRLSLQVISLQQKCRQVA